MSHQDIVYYDKTVNSKRFPSDILLLTLIEALGNLDHKTKEVLTSPSTEMLLI